jgi:glycoside/pentoside/hexuronide:cation symporter, GPH family
MQTNTTTAPPRPPLWVLIVYAIGQLGWSLASYGVGNLLTAFYMPPETGQANYPAYIYQGPVLGIFTLIGLLGAGGRLLDAIIDPIVANWSDRSTHRMGKRRWFLLMGALPLALFAWLVFMPATPEVSSTNFWWLALCIGLYYFFLAFYVIPYTALIAELGHDPADRMKISSIISVTFAVGFMLGAQAPALQGYLEAGGMAPVAALQRALLIFCGFAAICMLVPGLFLPERRYANQTHSEHGIKDALQTVLANRNFRYFLGSNLLYWLSLTFIQLGIFYYVPVLFGLDKSAASAFIAIGFICSFLLYVPINWLARRYGKKPLMLVAFGVFAAQFLIVLILPALPGPNSVWLYVLGAAAAFPLGVFGILPNAIVGDVVEAEARSSGRQLAGMFYGVGAFVMKIGVSLANLIFPSLLLLGKSTTQPLGIQATAVAAAIFCVAGWWVFRRFAVTDV